MVKQNPVLSDDALWCTVTGEGESGEGRGVAEPSTDGVEVTTLT